MRFLQKLPGARHLVTSCNLQINTRLYAGYLHTGGCLFAGKNRTMVHTICYISILHGSQR